MSLTLIKWFRKNNKKLMAVVVVLLMIAFIMPTSLRQLSQIRGGPRKTVAHFGDNKKLTVNDLASARLELEVLRALGANALLSNSRDLQAVLLGELLFSEQRISPKLIAHIKQLIKQSGYRVSDKQINDIYRRSMSSDVYWLLLKSEAEQAGIRIPEDLARKFLGGLITQLFPDTSYPQIVGALMNRHGITEKDMLGMFGKLVAVLEYARTVCSSEEITNLQLMSCASQENETIDVEFIKLDSGIFAAAQTKPSQQEMDGHFDKYKKFFAGTISEENPWGFGYKLPDRVRLEYIAIKLGDVSAIVSQPSQEDAEDYYQKHTREFTTSISSDPNDPNSPLVEQTKSYAEVASALSAHLFKEKIDLKAESILQEARTHTEAALDNVESQKLSAEQYKQLVGDYNSVADELSKKHKIKIYAGKTGLLNAMDLQTDKYLGSLYMAGRAYNPVLLPRIVFAIDELGGSELGPFDVPKPRMYENIGPLKDWFGQTMMVMRVIKTEKAAEPESINLAYAKNTLKLDSNSPEQDGRDIYSVKEKVAEDLRKLAAASITKTKAQEFVGLAVKHGWEKAADKFKKLYGQQFKSYESDPNFLKLQRLTNLQRISKDTIETLVVQCEGDPAGHFLVNNAQKNRQFVDQLYSLVPQDSNTVKALPLVMESTPDMSCYCLKSISVKRLSQQQYEIIKPILAYKETLAKSQNLAAVHFNPENILRRMKFKLAKENKEAQDANAPAGPKEVL